MGWFWMLRACALASAEMKEAVFVVVSSAQRSLISISLFLSLSGCLLVADVFVQIFAKKTLYNFL